MLNKICGRMLVRIKGTLASPMLVGSGENKETDMDAALGADGMPFIPGSSLAGVLKSDYDSRKKYSKIIDDTFLFGSPQFKKGEISYQSRIFVYDTTLGDENTRLFSRDGVKLNQYKASQDMSRFDMQMVPAGTCYTMRLELLVREALLEQYSQRANREQHHSSQSANREQYFSILSAIWEQDKRNLMASLESMGQGFLRLGARTSRGFGRLAMEEVKCRTFDMGTPDAYQEWLDWDQNWESERFFSKADVLFKEGKPCVEPASEECLSKKHCFSASFSVANTLLIREYRTGLEDKLDYGQLTVMSPADKSPKAVVPGSSWAGAVRSYLAERIVELGGADSWEAAQRRLDPFFGTWAVFGQRDKLAGSAVIFEESVIEDGRFLTLVRNSIDRFTGGAANQALFCERVCAGGKLELQIRWQERGELDGTAFRGRDLSQKEHKILCGLLLWAYFGLQHGILPIGGETGVGRGILIPVGGALLDGKELEQESCLRAAADWCNHSSEN